jgi:hypothetical protein
MNDLADRINSLNCGVPFDDFCLSLLLYAEDIALIAPDENSLQRMLYDWCTTWKLSINMYIIYCILYMSFLQQY